MQLGKDEKTLARRPGGEHGDLDVVGADEVVGLVHDDHVTVRQVADGLARLAARPHEVDEQPLTRDVVRGEIGRDGPQVDDHHAEVRLLAGDLRR